MRQFKIQPSELIRTIKINTIKSYLGLKLSPTESMHPSLSHYWAECERILYWMLLLNTENCQPCCKLCIYLVLLLKKAISLRHDLRTATELFWFHFLRVCCWGIISYSNTDCELQSYLLLFITPISDYHAH